MIFLFVDYTYFMTVNFNLCQTYLLPFDSQANLSKHTLFAVTSAITRSIKICIDIYLFSVLPTYCPWLSSSSRPVYFDSRWQRLLTFCYLLTVINYSLINKRTDSGFIKDKYSCRIQSINGGCNLKDKHRRMCSCTCFYNSTYRTIKSINILEYSK